MSGKGIAGPRGEARPGYEAPGAARIVENSGTRGPNCGRFLAAPRRRQLAPP